MIYSVANQPFSRKKLMACWPVSFLIFSVLIMLCGGLCRWLVKNVASGRF